MDMTEKILQRIDAICLSSSGYFVRPTVVFDHLEKAIFYRFMKRNGEMFDVIYAGRSHVNRANSLYHSYRGMLKSSSQHEGIEVARRLIWSAFITQFELREEFKSGVNMVNGIRLMVDDFSSEICNFDGTIVTTWSRSKEFKGELMVPKKLRDKRVEEPIMSFVSGSFGGDFSGAEMDDQEVFISNDGVIFEHLIEGGIWPERSSDCHSDERIYPLWERPIDGMKKWNYDISLIESGRFPKGYRFGVFDKNEGC